MNRPGRRPAAQLFAAALLVLLFGAPVGAAALQTSGADADAGERLRRAAQDGDRDAVADLLAAGAPVDAPNRYGATALFFAADRGEVEIVELLLAAGAHPDREDRFYRMTALSRAQASDRREVVLLLLRRGAAGAGGALRRAAGQGDLEVLAAAVENGRFDDEALRDAREAAAGNEPALRLLEDATALPAPPAEVAAADLEPLAGSYWREAAGEGYEVTRRGAALFAQRREASGDGERRAAGPSIPLTPGAAARTFTASLGTRAGEAPEAARFVFAGRGGMVERLVVERGGEAVAYDPEGEAESREPARPAEDAVPAEPAGADPAPLGPPSPWPQFRGPDGSGIADGQGAPVRWDAPAGQGILWEAPLPGLGVSSPIIWGDRVFALSAASAADREFRIGLYGDVAPVDDASEHDYTLSAFDLRSGEPAWTTPLHRGVPLTRRHTKSSQANATPVTDGERIVTVLGSAGLLLCHDLDGRLLWEREIGALNSGWFYDPGYSWGHSSSPVIHEDTVIVLADIHGDAFLGAFALDDGEPVWREPRNEVSTFSTPLVHRAAGAPEVVVNGTTIAGYDAASGRERWRLAPNSEIPIGVPLLGDGLLYVQAGYPPIRPIYAIRPGNEGDLSLAPGESRSEAIAWSHARGGVYIPSPLFYRGILYLNANNGRLAAYSAETGERLYRARLGGVGGSYAASPIAADGRLYFTSEEGDTFVVRAGPEYALVAENTVDRIVMATPAVSAGVMALRAIDRLYGIGSEDRP